MLGLVGVELSISWGRTSSFAYIDASTATMAALVAIAAAMTHEKPTTVEVRMAAIGTPRRLTVISWTGTSRRAARTKSIREAVYRPEFKHESTAVSTTAFMMWSAYEMPISVNALTYGEAPSSVSSTARSPQAGRVSRRRK